MAILVVVSDGVAIWVASLFFSLFFHLHVPNVMYIKTLEQPITKFTLAILVGHLSVERHGQPEEGEGEGHDERSGQSNAHARR